MNNIVRDSVKTLHSRTFRTLIFCVLVLTALSAATVLSKGGDPDGFLTVLMPMLITGIVYSYYGASQGANKTTVISIIALIYIGAVTQNLLGKISPETTGMHIMTATACFAVYALITQKITVNATAAAILCAAGSIGICLLLGVSGVDPNGSGTRAWFRFGGASVQGTDIVKLLYIYFIAALYSHSSLNDKDRFIFSTAVTAVVCGLLCIAVRELGTAMILAAVYVVFVFCFIRSRAMKIAVAAMILLCAAALWAIYANMSVLEDGDPFLGTTLGRTLDRISERVEILVRLDEIRTEAHAHQPVKAHEAALLGSLWGNDTRFHIIIPVAESDFIFPHILMTFGSVVGIVIILLYFTIFCRIKAARSPLRFASVTAFFVQSMLMIAGSVNCFLMSGIGLPLISAGGTQMIVSYILCCNILSGRDLLYA